MRRYTFFTDGGKSLHKYMSGVLQKLYEMVLFTVCMVYYNSVN